MSDFERFRDGATLAKPRKAKVTEPEYTIGPKELILCVDQSLAKSGWVLLRGDRTIVTTGVLAKPKDMSLDGFVASLARGSDLFTEAHVIIDGFHPLMLVHEQPPVGRMTGNNESSFVSATAWRCAARLCKVPVKMVQRQRAAKLLTGNGNAKKAVVQQAVRALLIDCATSDPTSVRYAPPVRITQDIIDAIAVGLTTLDGGAI